MAYPEFGSRGGQNNFYTRRVHKISFPLDPQLYCMKQLHVPDQVMTSRDACISRTSRVLAVASLQRLKMEALIPAPAHCEVRSVIKFLNAQSIVQTEIHHQLCEVYGHTARRSTHLLQEFSWEVFNQHPSYSLDLAPDDSYLLSHLKKFLSGQHQCFQNDTEAEMSVTVVPILGGRPL